MIPEKEPTLVERFLTFVGLSNEADQVEADRTQEAARGKFHTAVHDAKHAVGRKFTQLGRPKYESIDEIRDTNLPLASFKPTPADKVELLVSNLRDINEAIRNVPIDDDTLTHINFLCDHIERVIPKAISEVINELGDLKARYAKLMTHPGHPEIQGIVEQQEFLDAQLIEAFKLFTEIRNTINLNQNEYDDSTKTALNKIHDQLSVIMKQPTNGLNESIVIPSGKSSRLSAAKVILTERAYRRKLTEAIGYIFKGIGVYVNAAWNRYVLKDMIAESPASQLSKTKAKVSNCFASFAPIFSRQVFGKDLLAASRNVATVYGMTKNDDLIAAKYLEQKVEAMNPENPGAMPPANLLMTLVPNLSLRIEPAVHSFDGDCAGTSLQVCFETLEKTLEGEPLDVEGYLQIAMNMAQGVPPAAHANQALYEAFAESTNLDTPHLEAIMDEQQKVGLDPENGRSIYKADYKNVKACYDYIVSGTGMDGNELLVEAVQKVRVENRDLFKTTSHGERYIVNTKEFKEKVLEALAGKSGHAKFEQAKNELDWLIGNMEFRTVFNYCNNKIDTPFVTGADVDLASIKAAPSLEGILSAVGHTAIRDNLLYMIRTDRRFLEMQQTARARGLDLSRLEDPLEYTFGAKNDSEVLDRMDMLDNGVYLLSIELADGSHAMQFFKQDDRQYLFDPNFGLFDCSNGRHKEQITKLLKGLEKFYPPPKVQGAASDGTSHNITLLKVDRADRVAHPDQLAGFKPENYKFDENGKVVLIEDNSLS